MNDHSIMFSSIMAVLDEAGASYAHSRCDGGGCDCCGALQFKEDVIEAMKRLPPSPAKDDCEEANTKAFTVREQQVLGLLAVGMGVKQIENALSISSQRISQLRHSIAEKLHPRRLKLTENPATIADLVCQILKQQGVEIVATHPLGGCVTMSLTTLQKLLETALTEPKKDVKEDA